jgi:hypothetical protein
VRDTLVLSIFPFLSIVGLAACSSSSDSSPGSDAAPDQVHPSDAANKSDGHAADAAHDTSTTDAGHDAVTPDTGLSDVRTAVEASTDANDHDSAGGSPDAAKEGGYPSCAASWLAPPTLPSDGGAILLPPPEAGTLSVLLHGQVRAADAGGGGTQNYICGSTVDGGAYSWVLTGPSAKLDDCNGTFLIEHTASDAGATRPQWASQIDDSVVVGKKIDALNVTSTAVPWLLLQEVSASGTGLLDKVKYIQRVNTSAGVATGTCDAAHAGDTVSVPYTADYYFYGE